MPGKVSHQSHLSNLGVENAPCLMHPPILSAQAAGWITKVTSQNESSQILSFFLFKAFVFMQERHAYDFSQIRTFSYTEMTKNGILTFRDFCSGEICCITPIPHSITSSSFPVKLIGENNLKEMETESTLIEQCKFSSEQIKES